MNGVRPGFRGPWPRISRGAVAAPAGAHRGWRVALALWLTGLPCPRPARAGGLPASYAALAEEAARTHPELRSLEATTRAQRARIDRAGALPDPMLMLEWSMLPLKYPFSLSRTEMAGVEVSLQQELPFPGKRGFAQQAERVGIEVLESRAADTARVLRGAVAQLYFELAFLHEALQLLERNERVLLSLAEHAKAQVAAGRSFSVDILRSRSELSLVKERRYALEARRVGAQARLNALLGRAGASALPQTEPLGAPPSLPPVSELLRRAEAERPSLRGREAEVRRSQAEARRADRERYPNFIVGASYRFRSGPPEDMVQGSDFYSLRFGVTLPIWGRQSAEAREAAARVDASREDVESERRRVAAEVHRLYAEWRKERLTLSLYADEVRPLAEATLRAAIPVYVAGRTDFHVMLQTWVRVLDTDLDKLRALAALHAKAAEVETAVGAPLGPELPVQSSAKPSGESR